MLALTAEVVFFTVRDFVTLNSFILTRAHARALDDDDDDDMAMMTTKMTTTPDYVMTVLKRDMNE